MVTWTLVIMLIGTGHNPTSGVTVPGFTSQELCQEQVTLLPQRFQVPGSGGHIRGHCVKVS